jgi:hypothetical protein
VRLQQEKGGKEIGLLKVFPNGEDPLRPFRVSRAGVVKEVTLVVQKGGRKGSCLDGLGEV